MTIPTLHQNITEKTTAAQLKKVYSTFENAFRLAVSENGTPETWSLTRDKQGSRNFFEKLKPYLNIINSCDNMSDCFTADYKQLNGTAMTISESYATAIILADGTPVAASFWREDCKDAYGENKTLSNVCGWIMVDVNGNKKPNIYGKDYFSFHVTKYGIVPRGSDSETLTMWNFKDYCLNKQTATGESCAAWVIYNENLDYLHCDDLSWTGKRKCS